MDELCDLLENLGTSLSDGEISNDGPYYSLDPGLVGALLQALKQNPDFLPASKIQKILPLLKSHLAGDEMNLTTMLLELTAEICKSEDGRQHCVDAGLIPRILNCIETEDPDILLQMFRALGNIACDNNKAREEILEVGGIDKILKKLKELCNEETQGFGNRHRTNACGALLNLSFDNETLQRELIQHGTIPLLLGYMENTTDDNKLALMAANAVSCLVDSTEGISSFIESRGCKTFVKSLKTSSGELTKSLTECLKELSEEDVIKQALVSEKCVDILQEIIRTNVSSNDSEDVLEKLKISVDLIILLLGEDNCLVDLFDEEKNLFVDKILLWTHSNIAYVRNSCPVAIGNIARTEPNCIILVKMEVHHRLLGLLRKVSQNTETEAIQLQISVLSALKNLAIPASNKRILIDAGALDCALEFLRTTETPLPLVFRATSVVRLLVQGQDAGVDTVCSHEQCIVNLVALAYNSGIEGLKSEASRLLAALLKNARKSESILAVVKNNGLLPVINMVSSTHTTMQNEALVGIALAVTVISNGFSHKLDESDLLATINNVLSAINAEPQTQYNSIAVIEAIFLKGLVEKSKLEDCGILQNLETLKNHSNGAVQQRASTVLNQIRNHKL